MPIAHHLSPASLKTFLRLLVLALIAGGCSGGGCGGCGSTEPIPGGFPTASRVANAIQVRVSESAIAAIEEDPAALVGQLLPGGGLSIDVPASCDGDPEICCAGGTPSASCGPVNIDLGLQDGDAPRLEINPIQSEQKVDLVIRARLQTEAAIPVKYLGISCDIDIDTAGGNRDEVTLTMTMNLPQDQDEATTRLEVSDETIDLENDDVSVGGNFLCGGVNLFLKGFIVDLLTDNITTLLGGGISDQMCSACESGTTTECGAAADACTDNVCMIGDRCEQRLGVTGRMAISSLFGGFSSGQLGKMDIYQVAGGYAETDDEGVSLGLYSGALPFAEPRDRCGPAATPPVAQAIAQSSFFTGNIRPDTSEPFGVGFGIHQQVLDQFAYALYDSGALCLNLSAGTLDLLSTDGLAPLLMPSVLELLHGVNSPIVIGLRPQAPPTMQIGAGTTSVGEGGETVIDDPLLDVRFDGVEIDFFVMVDDQFIRAMTLKADLALPMNLEINEMGEIEPVIGDIENAITNVSVSNSEALRETDAELEAKIPVLLSLALGPLVDSLGSFALPSFGGLNIQIAPNGILSIEDNAFLAIFADFVFEGSTARVHTEAALEGLERGTRPVAHLQLGGDQEQLEFSFRVDGGIWSPYTQSKSVALHRAAFHLLGEHRIEVRARQLGRPMTTDRSPAVLVARFHDKPESSYFHGNQDEGGCNCNSSGSAGGWLAVLAILMFFGRRRRVAANASLLPMALVLTAALGSQACNCGSDPQACPDGCLEGEVERGPTGRYSSLAAADGRVLAAAYDERLGDLVLAERQDDASLQYRVVAGAPLDAPTYEPDGYRGGVAAPGPDVGLWTSIALHEGLALIAYVDRDTGALHLAREAADSTFGTELIDDSAGRLGASHVSLSVSSEGEATVAYLASGLSSPDNAGFVAQLRASSASTDWEPQVVDVGPISCGGLCESPAVCVASGAIEECTAPSGTCEGCGDDEACIEGSCVARIEAPSLHDIHQGVGLFAQLLHRSDDSMVLAYYDRVLGNLAVATSTGTGFVPAASYDDALDTGMWLSAAVDEDDLTHLAFQDANGDRLMYATFADDTIASVEFVDEGLREGDTRTHPVGASAAIWVGGDRVPQILYQDALTADVDHATREQDSWSRSTLMNGDRLNGFFMNVVRDGDAHWASHYFYDQAAIPQGELEIIALP